SRQGEVRAARSRAPPGRSKRPCGGGRGPGAHRLMDAIQKQLTDLLNLLTRGQPFGWNNVLDVLIVAVFVYYVLALIRGTRAVQLLIGVMVLVLIYFVASYLHLPLTTLLLQALFAVPLLALVVAFRPVPRRA